MDEITLTLNNPITEEQWDMIVDVDFEHTESILFHTKHGKEAEFVKRKKGKWIDEWRLRHDGTRYWYRACSECGFERNDDSPEKDTNFCPNCGADMRGEEHG